MKLAWPKSMVGWSSSKNFNRCNINLIMLPCHFGGSYQAIFLLLYQAHSHVKDQLDDLVALTWTIWNCNKEQFDIWKTMWISQTLGFMQEL